MAGSRRVTSIPRQSGDGARAGAARMDRRSSGDQVAGHIRRLIFDGHLRQGDRVRQDEIATELGVSRIPVREAIIALDREGWVTIEPHRGAFVQALDERFVSDQYELLGLIFALAARRAAERGDPGALDVLQSTHHDLLAADEPGDFARRNDAFLRQLFVVADSARLRSVTRVMQGIVPGNFFAVVPGTIEVHKAGTAEVVAAIRAGDADGAAGAYQRLLRRQGALLTDLLGARHILASTQPAASATP